MIEKKIDNLRDKLYAILETQEYTEILKISQELDEFIVQYMREKVISGTAT